MKLVKDRSRPDCIPTQSRTEVRTTPSPQYTHTPNGIYHWLKICSLAPRIGPWERLRIAAAARRGYLDSVATARSAAALRTISCNRARCTARPTRAAHSPAQTRTIWRTHRPWAADAGRDRNCPVETLPQFLYGKRPLSLSWTSSLSWESDNLRVIKCKSKQFYSPLSEESSNYFLLHMQM